MLVAFIFLGCGTIPKSKDNDLSALVGDIEKLELPDPAGIAYEDKGNNVQGPDMESFPNLKKIDTKVLGSFSDKLEESIDKVKARVLEVAISVVN